jgi:hypothetical protein
MLYSGIAGYSEFNDGGKSGFGDRKSRWAIGLPSRKSLNPNPCNYNPCN